MGLFDDIPQENSESAVTLGMFDDIPIEPKEKTTIEKISEYRKKPAEFASKLLNVLNPFSDIEEAAEKTTRRISGITQGSDTLRTADIVPFDPSGLRTLEQAGTEVKGAASDVIGRGIEKIPIPQFQNPNFQVAAELGRQIGKKIIQTGIEAAPFTPSEFSAAAGGEMLSVAGLPFLAKRKQIAKSIAEEYAPESIKVMTKRVKTKGASLGEELLKNPKYEGSRRKVLNKALNEREVLENQIQDELSKTAKEEILSGHNTIKKDEISGVLDDLVNEYKISGVNESDVNKLLNLKRMFEANHPGTMTVMTANRIKRALYRNIGDINYVKENPTAIIQGEQALARALREKIAEIVPAIRKLNSEQGFALRLIDSLAPTIAKSEKAIGTAIKGGFKEATVLRAARSQYRGSLPVNERTGIGLGLGTILNQLGKENR